ncbi:aminotransferase class I/II-fold pyridoxal phosphate-dependent enzyme [Patescibacteria group bacterium]|nr:aminotransferase class I/II-fold pyridoxal phosphate-dependent enzyme [Patescibacteria group bacterium]
MVQTTNGSLIITMPILPIHHTFAPHVDARYVLRTLTILLAPWKWRSGKSKKILSQELKQRLSADVYLFSSGREALCTLLRALKLNNGEEVVVQSYTCVAVPNAIHSAGGVPIYADIDRETLNLTSETVEEKITQHTKAVICQHTFGIPAPTKELRALCDRHSLLLIEDCAHIIPDQQGPESIGQHGDFVFYSFGRDKAVSGITGGVLLSRKSDISLKLNEEIKRAVPFSHFTILRYLTYPLVYFIARPFYGLFLGKAFLYLLKKLKWMVPVLTIQEKEGHQSPITHQLPNALAFLVIGQFKRLNTINDHRRKLTKFYLEEGTKHNWPLLAGITSDLPLQKFPLFVRNAGDIRRQLKKKNIHLDDGWTGCVVCPATIDLDPTNYVPGSDPEAEAACELILSLPTHPTMTLRQAREMSRQLNKLL